MMPAALNGLKVMEYGKMVSAPYCTKLLAGLGAEVIKIENPGTGDESRHHGPFPNDIPDLEKPGGRGKGVMRHHLSSETWEAVKLGGSLGGGYRNHHTCLPRQAQFLPRKEGGD
jgi:crotonobetainyl-CoA:carnitine CoA-transferase CaiB-like acyl-CoA transferase